MASNPLPRSEVHITAVRNGFIVTPRSAMYRDAGYSPECYVFSTAEQMAGWVLKQEWDTPESKTDADRGA